MVGKSACVSQSKASRILELFSNRLVDSASEFIYFPFKPEDIHRIKYGFSLIRGFPNVIGCVDGTHVGIIAPSVDSFAYVNRKQNHSLNIQVVTDETFLFRDVVAKGPGSAHDIFIWRNSTIRPRFQQGDLHGVITTYRWRWLPSWSQSTHTLPTEHQQTEGSQTTITYHLIFVVELLKGFTMASKETGRKREVSRTRRSTALSSKIQWSPVHGKRSNIWEKSVLGKNLCESGSCTWCETNWKSAQQESFNVEVPGEDEGFSKQNGNLTGGGTAKLAQLTEIDEPLLTTLPKVSYEGISCGVEVRRFLCDR